MTNTNMDRRSFLKGAGVAGAAAVAAGTIGLAGCAPKEPGALSGTGGDGELILDAEKFTNAKSRFRPSLSTKARSPRPSIARSSSSAPAWAGW